MSLPKAPPPSPERQTYQSTIELSTSTTTTELITNFLRKVFKYNCSCYNKSCKIDTMTADKDVGDNINALISFFRSSSSVQQCVTIFSGEDYNHCKLIDAYIDTFVRTGLIKILTKYVSSTDPILGKYTVQGESKKEENVLHPIDIQRSCVEINETPIYACQIGKTPFLKPVNGNKKIAVNCVTFHNNQPVTWEAIKQGHNHANPESCYCYPLSYIKADLEEITGKPLTDETLHLFAQVLFWYLRKSIVDNLIQLVAQSDNPTNSCLAMSVGSTRITSDYDVTVQGRCVESILQKFNEYFYLIFGETSDIVFDTNLYGTTFALSYKPAEEKYFKAVNCAENKFDKELYYLLMPEGLTQEQASTSKVKWNQRAWAFMKVFTALTKMKQTISHGTRVSTFMAYMLIINERILHILEGEEEMEKQAFSRIIQGSPVASKSASEVLKNRTVAVSPTQNNGSGYRRKSSSFSAVSKEALIAMQRAKQLSQRYDLPSKDVVSIPSLNYSRLPFNLVFQQTTYLDTINMISLYNYFGNETYFTRGAFLDVVFSQQTCKNGKFTNGTQLTLTEDDYLDSFLENFGDYMQHHFKEKYVMRMKTALENYIKLTGHQGWLSTALMELKNYNGKSNTGITTLVTALEPVVKTVYKEMTSKGNMSLLDHVKNNITEVEKRVRQQR